MLGWPGATTHFLHPRDPGLPRTQTRRWEQSTTLAQKHERNSPPLSPSSQPQPPLLHLALLDGEQRLGLVPAPSTLTPGVPEPFQTAFTETHLCPLSCFPLPRTPRRSPLAPLVFNRESREEGGTDRPSAPWMLPKHALVNVTQTDGC